MRVRSGVVLVVQLALLGAACGPPPTTPELRGLLERGDSQAFGTTKDVWSDTIAFYTARQQRFAWVDGDGPTEKSRQAIDVLRSAEAHGLDAADYSEPTLRDLSDTLDARRSNDDGKRDERVAELEVRLTAALLELARHVAVGRVDPLTVDRRWNVQRDPPDYVAALQNAYAQGVATFLPAVQPRHPEYAALMQALSTVPTTDSTTNATRRTIALNLERWRWLPDDLGAQHFLVNVPQFELVAREQGKVVLAMRVVVGKRGNETPLFSDRMEQVVFSPFWNVPEAIAEQETAPAAASDPGFLARNNMEIVDGQGRTVSPEAISWGDEDALKAFRFRQRPGASNALGLVKFLFPNDHAVYLHDTPADALFNRPARAFSHGCVRVEEPEALARYVLREQPQWTPEAIRTAMHAGDERHVKLTTPIPVHIVYMTAWVDEQGLHIENDVYGYDARQERRTKN